MFTASSFRRFSSNCCAVAIACFTTFLYFISAFFSFRILLYTVDLHRLPVHLNSAEQTIYVIGNGGIGYEKPRVFTEFLYTTMRLS